MYEAFSRAVSDWFRKAKEEWTLSQTGNWDNEKRDLNGDGDQADADERNWTNTFDNANKYLTRNGVSVTYNAAGGQTLKASGVLNNHAYVYDPFGRLREWKHATLANVYARYRSNGLGHRIMWQYDRTDNETLNNDERYYFAYDERWRMVATFRDQDVTRA